MTEYSLPDTRQILAGLTRVIAEHDRRNTRGWCLACLDAGVHNRYPCEVLRRYEKAAERLRSALARATG